jgi:hypothetical protein
MCYDKLIKGTKAISINLNWWRPYPKISIQLIFQIFGSDNWFHIGLNLFQLFNIKLAWSRKCDHAGIIFDIEILGLDFEIYLYDTRHWDYDNDCWVKYEDDIWKG